MQITDRLTGAALRPLLAAVEGPCVSIYLPTHRAGVETRQDPIRLKNLRREAARGLRARQVPDSESRKLLKPIRSLLNDYDFWQHQSQGLAVFLGRDFFRRYRVPWKVPELAVVADRFHLKPLLPLVTADSRFYLLALSQNQVRVFHATRDGISEVETEGVPKSLREALGLEAPGRQLQSHTAASVQAGRQGVVFHGQNGRAEEHKEALREFFRRVDRGLRELLAGDEAPLILAAVDYFYPIYRPVNSHPALLEEWVPGSPDDVAPHELHRRALPLAVAHFRKAQSRAAERYLELAGTNLASNVLQEILPAAAEGRVETLSVAVGVQQWGRFVAASGETTISAEPGPGDEDLLNLAAIHTFASGGAVYAVGPEAVPGGGHLAAVLRY